MLFLSFSLRPPENTCISASRGPRDKVKKKNHQIYTRDPLSNHLTPWRACTLVYPCVLGPLHRLLTLKFYLFNWYHLYYICCICVFVYLCICILVFALLTQGNIIFDILELSSFQKYTTWWVFLALCNMLYLCICVFVYLCICIWVGKVTARPIWPKKCQSAFFNFLIWAT